MLKRPAAELFRTFLMAWHIIAAPKFASVHCPGAMPETDAERYRKAAGECREQAEKSVSALDKEAWLRLEADWIKLAQEADRKRF
jgi:hypothetical protein